MKMKKEKLEQEIDHTIQLLWNDGINISHSETIPVASSKSRDIYKLLFRFDTAADRVRFLFTYEDNMMDIPLNSEENIQELFCLKEMIIALMVDGRIEREVGYFMGIMEKDVRFSSLHSES